MALSNTLQERCHQQCESCGAAESLNSYELPNSVGRNDSDIALCQKCETYAQHGDYSDHAHWHCLNDSMWSTTPAVQVFAARILNRLREHTWAQDLLDMLYLDAELQQWVDADQFDPTQTPTVDSNGAPLLAGDSVTLTKDLDVKGTSFIAKRGTTVRNIALTNNPEHIEGKVNGTRIVILTKFTKKAG